MNDDNPWGAPSPPLAATTPVRAPTPSDSPTVKLASFGDDDDWGLRDMGVVPPSPAAAPESVPVAAPVDAEEEKDEFEEVPVTKEEEEVTTRSVPAEPARKLSIALSLPPMDEGPPMDDFDDDDVTEEAAQALGGGAGEGSTLQTSVVGDAFDDDDGFGDDDFGDMGGNAGADDDDFGDFGGDDDAFGSASPATTFEIVPEPPVASTSTAHYPSPPPFRLNLSTPTRTALAPQLTGFLDKVYPAAATSVSDEPERQVDGPGQMLVTESSRALLTSLSSIPPLRPLDWRRSKIRREHLITLGVPVNLDDSAEVKPLSNLVVPSARTASPSRFHNAAASPQSTFTASPLPSRSSTPTIDASPRQPPRRGATPAPPSLDKRRADEICAIEAEDLNLLSLTELQTLKAELERLSIDASGMLTHALLLREKLTGDGETYHGMIQDLVKAAARTKTTRVSGSSSISRSGSGQGRWSVGSATRKGSGGTPSAVR